MRVGRELRIIVCVRIDNCRCCQFCSTGSSSIPSIECIAILSSRRQCPYSRTGIYIDIFSCALTTVCGRIQVYTIFECSSCKMCIVSCTSRCHIRQSVRLIHLRAISLCSPAIKSEGVSSIAGFCRLRTTYWFGIDFLIDRVYNISCTIFVLEGHLISLSHFVVIRRTIRITRSQCQYMLRRSNIGCQIAIVAIVTSIDMEVIGRCCCVTS